MSDVDILDADVFSDLEHLLTRVNLNVYKFELEHFISTRVNLNTFIWTRVNLNTFVCTIVNLNIFGEYVHYRR